MMILLPLLLTGLLYFFYGTTQMEIRSSLLQTCRVDLIKTQVASSEWIQGLMALNPLIELIKNSKKIAKGALLVPGLGPLVTVIAQGVLAIAGELSALIPILQQKILSSLWVHMELGLSLSEQSLRQLLNDFKGRSKALFEVETLLVVGNHPHSVSLKPDTPKEALSTYSPKEDFLSEQSLRLHWVYELRWKNPFSRSHPLRFTYHDGCSVSNLKEDPWTAVLHRDKLLSSFF